MMLMSYCSVSSPVLNRLKSLLSIISKIAYHIRKKIRVQASHRRTHSTLGESIGMSVSTQAAMAISAVSNMGLPFEGFFSSASGCIMSCSKFTVTRVGIR